jgi:hypothetical protein
MKLRCSCVFDCPIRGCVSRVAYIPPPPITVELEERCLYSDSYWMNDRVIVVLFPSEQETFLLSAYPPMKD